MSKKKIDIKSILPHVVVIVLFALLSAIYFSPVVKGKVLPQMDNTHAIGAAHEIAEYQKSTGEVATWTDSMFGGMPAYQIKADSSSNIFHKLCHWVRLGLPYETMGILFLYLIGFYALMLSLGIDWKVSAAGAIAFALGSYNIIIIAAGHITKCYAIAMMPVVIGGVLLAFRGKYVAGGLMTMVGLGLELAYNHVQITYYLAIALLVLVIMELVWAIKGKEYGKFGKSIGVLAVAATLAILPSMANLLPTYEYGKYSIRGASELKVKAGEKEHDGLDKEYALGWSYGVHETPTLLIPNVVGGASQAIGEDLKSVRNVNPKEVRDAVANQSQYWGGRSFTSGPVYVGAIVCFLFFIGCFYYKGRLKWWLIAATVVSIMLAWGKNFSILTDLMFYYFPLYNKFRTVEMALVIATVTIPTLSFLGLKAIYDNPEDIKYDVKWFFVSIGLTAGVSLLLAMAPTLFYDFLSPMEAQALADAKAQNPAYALVEEGMINARIELMRGDALRTAVLILLGSSALWFCSVRKINRNVMVGTIVVLTLIDLWGVDRRYLSSDNFVEKRQNNSFVMSAADKEILADTEPHRVISVYTSPFNEVYTSYYHHSVGGYHGAKLRRYQDIIDRYMMDEWSQLRTAIQSGDYEGIDRVLAGAKSLNMMNTKYVIYNPGQKPIVNRYAMPRAWYVEDVKAVATADEAIDAIGESDLGKTAIVEGAGAVKAQAMEGATVRQTKYTPEQVEYETEAPGDGVVVFSEIYYPAGWTATIDGKDAEILHADYVLRALAVPAGKHKIEFKFEPKSFATGKVIGYVSSVIVVLLLAVGIVYTYRRKSGDEKA